MGHETVDLYLRNGNQLFCGEISSQFQNRMGKSKEQMQQERSVIPFGRRKRYKKKHKRRACASTLVGWREYPYSKFFGIIIGFTFFNNQSELMIIGYST